MRIYYLRVIMTFGCERCGNEFSRKAHLLSHLTRKIPCEPTKSNVDTKKLLDDLLKQRERPEDVYKYKCEHCNKGFKSSQGKYLHKQSCKEKDKANVKPEVATDNKNSVDVQKLLLDLQYYKNKRNEQFYQLMLQQHLKVTHKTLSFGVTDITTDDCHAEIKEWSCWKEAVGQLTCYNIVDPKPNLAIYLFGKYGGHCKKVAKDIMTQANFHVYEFKERDDMFIIEDLTTNNIVFEYIPEK